MSDNKDNSSRNPLGRQPSISSLEQSLNMVSAPPAIAPVTIYPGPGAKHAKMAKADLEILQRLQQLRQSDTEIPSELEMAHRLAKLKGLPADYYIKPSQSAILSTDRRSQQQKTEDLLAQVSEEVNIENRLPKPEEDLALRLQQLRCGPDVLQQPIKAPAPIQTSIEGPGAPQGLEDIDEVAKLLKEVSQSATKEAREALASLDADPEVNLAIQSVKNKEPHRSRDVRRDVHYGAYSTSTEEGEKISGASDDDRKKRHTRMKRTTTERNEKKTSKKNDAEEEEDEDEVKRIVNYYSQRSQDKKKKVLKKKKAGKKMTKCKAAADSETDSSSELSDSDDLTSDSEKLSDSSH